MKQLVDLHVIRERIGNWLDKNSEGLSGGRFRFCIKGGLVDPESRVGAFVTCFVVKTALQTGIWESWSENYRRDALDFIASFQRDDGMFYDPFLGTLKGLSLKVYAAALLGRCSWPKSRCTQRIMNLRADTRQESLTLLNAGRHLDRPLSCELTTVDDVDRFFDSLDWSVPWGSGSHLSHQLVFRTVNFQQFGIDDGYQEVTTRVLERLNGIRHAEDGCWYCGEVAPDQKINGAMKVFSMLCWLDRPLPDCTELLRFALARPFLNDGCGFLNRLWVVYNACKSAVITENMNVEINRIVEQAVRHTEDFVQSDGGYSFRTNGSQTCYYGCRVSDGLPVGDVQGTYMITWALALCASIAPGCFAGAEKWKVVLP